MNQLIKYITKFVVIGFIQALILNQLEIGWGIQVMVYPLFIMLLPINFGIIPMLLIAFLFGMSIDSISNTFGLHTSSLLVFTYLRPICFKIFSPRDGYENIKEASTYELGFRWFFFVNFSLLFLHHLWFFSLEIFRMSEILYIFQKTLFSLPISLLLVIIMQTIFISRPKER